MVKLDTRPRRSQKHRCAARKATSTEATLDDPDPDPDAQPPGKQTKPFITETSVMTQRRTLTTRYAHTGTQFVCFCHWLSRKELFALIIIIYSLAHVRADARPLRHTEPDNTGPLSHTEPPAPLTHRATSTRHRNVPPAPPEQVLLKILPFACRIPPLKFCQIFTLFFIPQGAAPRKGSAKPPQRVDILREHCGHFKLRG